VWYECLGCDDEDAEILRQCGMHKFTSVDLAGILIGWLLSHIAIKIRY
jgi:hypothetical protein